VFAVKKITILFFIMTMSSIFAMERLSGSQNHEIITFKSLQGFPLICLNKGKNWVEKLSEKKRNQVRECMIHHNDMRLLALFNVATKLPLDLQRALVLKMFHNNENAADKFLNMPIVDALECCAWSRDLSWREKDCFKCLLRFSDATDDMIFQCSKELIVFDDVYSRRFESIYWNKNELESLVKLQDRFQCSDDWPLLLSYQFYELPTMNHFKKQFNIGQVVTFPLALALYIHLNFPAGMERCYDQDTVEYNQLAERFNTGLKSLRQRTGRFWDKDRAVIDNPYILVLNQFFVIKALSWMIAATPFAVYCGINAVSQNRMEMVTKRDVGKFGISLLGLLKLIYLVGSQFEQESPWGIGCMAGVYGLMCCAYNAMKMYSWRQGWVSFKEIPALLQRTDIVIK
jgi:hypothetical protein